MQAFKTLTAVPAILPIAHIDTDQIIPAEFLKTTEKSGLGNHLFSHWRYNADGSENPEFVLNKPAHRNAQILIAGDNFGCGSSREHAPWALADFGIRVIISTSFADIFKTNAFKNGILPLSVEPEIYQRLIKFNHPITVDLETNIIKTAEIIAPFKIPAFQRYCLLNGIRELAFLLSKQNEIKTYEEQIHAR